MTYIAGSLLALEPVPTLPGAEKAEAAMSIMDVIAVGVGVLALFLLVAFIMGRVSQRGVAKELEAARLLAEPIYTRENGDGVTIPAGWYPAPDGLQDRYHDGRAWTGVFRPRTEASRVGDPPPPGITPIGPSAASAPPESDQ